MRFATRRPDEIWDGLMQVRRGDRFMTADLVNRFIEEIRRQVLNAFDTTQFEVRDDGAGMQVRLAEVATEEENNYAFGVSVQEGKVHVNAGYVIHFANSFGVDDTDVTVVGGTEYTPRYVTLKYTYSIGAEIETVARSSMPVPDNTQFAIPLCSAYESDGKVKIVAVHHVGNLIIPAVMAP